MPQLTLRHYQVRGARIGRNPRLGDSTPAPEKLASRIRMLERGRLHDEPALPARVPCPEILRNEESASRHPQKVLLHALKL